MKNIICRVTSPWDVSHDNVTGCLEQGVTKFIAPPELVSKIKPLGRTEIISTKDAEDTDVVLLSSPKASEIKELKKDGLKLAVEYVIQQKSDEERIIEAAKAGADQIFVSALDWKVIPFENLIAELNGIDCSLYAKVETEEDAELALRALEVGVDGVIVPAEAKWLKGVIRDIHGNDCNDVDLIPSEIEEIRPLRNGDRVCVDTCSLLVPGEGMLIGSQSDTFYLVHGETLKTEFADPRPFRVNAGAVHGYALMADGRTKYLSELGTGDEVAIINNDGRACRSAIIGRSKIETRPLLLIRSRINGYQSSIILQNAETIMLVSEEGIPKSVSNLEKGDKVLVHRANGGRHFGKAIQETIIEK